MANSQNGKISPHDISAEEAVIGSLLIDGNQIINVGRLQPSDFYHEPLGIIFTACQALYHRISGIDQITVAQELERMGKLEMCGGVPYLLHMTSIVPTPLDIPDYAAIVIRLSIARKAIVLGEKISAAGFEGAADQSQTLNKITELVQNFRKTSTKMESIMTPRDSADMLFDMVTKFHDRKPGTRTYYGFADMDRVTSGIEPGEYVLYGARPSVGKSQLLWDILDEVERQGKHVLVVSAEMSAQHLMERRIAKLLHKSIREIRLGAFTETEEATLMGAVESISETNTYTLPVNVTSQEIYTHVDKLMQQVGLDLVMIDYLQLLEDCYGERENQNIRVGRVSKVLKSISRDFNIGVHCAAQLHRSVESRPEDDRLPVLSDFKESGNLEQDADVAWLLHRYMGNQPLYDGSNHDPRLLRVKLAKNRQLGTAPAQTLLWSDELRRYVNYTGTL